MYFIKSKKISDKYILIIKSRLISLYNDVHTYVSYYNGHINYAIYLDDDGKLIKKF